MSTKNKLLFVSEGENAHMLLLRVASIPEEGSTLVIRPQDTLMMGPGGEALFFHGYVVTRFCDDEECLCRRLAAALHAPSVPHARVNRVKTVELNDLTGEQYWDLIRWQPSEKEARRLLNQHAESGHPE